MEDKKNGKGKVIDIIYDTWLHKGAMVFMSMGIAEKMIGKNQTAQEIGKECGLDPAMLFRLLRMLTNLEDFVIEDEEHKFRLGYVGECSIELKAVAALQNTNEHWTFWSKLPDILKTGVQNGFKKSFGKDGFEYMKENEQYKTTFQQAMTSITTYETENIVKNYDFSNASKICDLGGGHGFFLSQVLKSNPKASGVILELEFVVKESTQNKSFEKFGIADRCVYQVGDFLSDTHTGIPSDCDYYLMKKILHDWSDESCVKILKNISKATGDKKCKVLVVDYVVSDPGIVSLSKVFDVHMMCWGEGKERSKEEFEKLLNKAGWNLCNVINARQGGVSIVEAEKQ